MREATAATATTVSDRFRRLPILLGSSELEASIEGTGTGARQASDEAVSTARYGLDISRMLSRVAQRPPQLVNRRVDPMLEIDERPIAPEPLTKLLTRHKTTVVGEQQQQNFKRLARKANAYSAFSEPPAWAFKTNGPNTSDAGGEHSLAVW